MAFKKTSEHGLVFPRSINPAGAFLADFDIDGAILKRDHIMWLEENIIAPADAKRHKAGIWHIDLIGRASKSGSDGHNMVLSGERVKAVEAFIGRKLIGIPFRFFTSALGESSPIELGEYENELDRSVEVRVSFVSVVPPKRIKPHILIPKIIPWKPRPNRKVMDFKLQVLKADISIVTLGIAVGPLFVGKGHAGAKLLIKINEIGSTDTALYEFIGKGPGMILGAEISLGKVKPGLSGSDWSGTYKAGEVHTFATDVEMDAEDFEGPALFRFDALGRTLNFGPKGGWSGPKIRVKNLSFGFADEDIMKYAEADAIGEMKIVKTIPSWAR